MTYSGGSRRRPFSPYLAEGLLLCAIGSTLANIFIRHIPFSLNYLFELGLFLIGAALMAKTRRVITEWFANLICVIGGVILLTWVVYITV